MVKISSELTVCFLYNVITSNSTLYFALRQIIFPCVVFGSFSLPLDRKVRYVALVVRLSRIQLQNSFSKTLIMTNFI